MIWKVPNRRSFLITAPLAVWWVLLAVLAWKWSAGHLPAAIGAFTGILRVTPPPVARLGAHWTGVALQAAGLVLVLFALAGIGRTATEWVIRPALSRAETFAMHGLAGTGIFCTAVFALGLAGLLVPGILRAGWGAALLAALFRRPVRPEWPGEWLKRGGNAVLAAPVAILFAILAALSLAPEVTEDALVYHLGAPAHFLSIHKIAAAPHLKFMWPLLTENLLASFAGFLEPSVYRWTGLLLLSLLLAGWTSRRWGPAAAALALFSLLSSPVNSTLATVVKPDLFASAYVLLALIVWTEKKAGPSALLCGLALGFAYCTKQTAAVAAAGILAWHLLRPTAFPRRSAAQAGLGFIAGVLPFMARGWLMAGNPVYPFWFGGLGWSDTAVALMRKGWPPADLDPGNPAGIAASVGRLLSAEGGLALAGLPLLAFYRIEMPGARLAVWAAGTMAALVWLFHAPYSRFFMPVLPVLYALGAAGLGQGLTGGRLRRAAVAALTICIVVPGFIRAIALADSAGPARKHALPASLGLETTERFLEENLTGYLGAVRTVAKSGCGTGAHRLLLVGDARGAIFSASRITLSQDVPDFSLALRIAREARNAEGIRKRFRQAGITAIALNYVNSARLGILYATLGIYWTDAELGRYREYFSRYAEQAGPAEPYDFRNGGWAIFRLRATPAPKPAEFTFLPGTEGLGMRMPGENNVTAILRLRRHIRIAPRVAVFHCRLGGLLAQEKRWKEALAELNAGLAGEYPDAEPYGWRGVTLAALGRKTEALRNFRRAASLMPEDQR